MTIIFGFTIGCFDELHQNFIQGRHTSIDDLLFDCLGILFSFVNYKNFY
jgi:VanZ family protein